MQWHEYTLRIRPDQEEAACAVLIGRGIDSLEIEDGLIPKKEDLGQMFVDLSPELAPDELPPAGEAKIRFYLRTEAAPEEAAPQTGDAVDDSYTIHDEVLTEEALQALLEDLKQSWEAAGLGECCWEESTSREEDWRDSWKQFYKPLLVGDLLILPCWEEVPEQYAEDVREGLIKLLILDPGTAFGSGTHESTRLCLDGLKKWHRGGEHVLDIGCGSGILSLAALAYGADSVTMTETDPACETVVEENFTLNKIDKDKYKLLMGNILQEDKGRFGQDYDLILCNILAPVICALAAPGEADSLTKPGAIFITSGIYREHQQIVEECFRANPAWEWVETARLGDWVSVVARRR